MIRAYFQPCVNMPSVLKDSGVLLLTLPFFCCCFHLRSKDTSKAMWKDGCLSVTRKLIKPITSPYQRHVVMHITTVCPAVLPCTRFFWIPNEILGASINAPRIIWLLDRSPLSIVISTSLKCNYANRSAVRGQSSTLGPLPSSPPMNSQDPPPADEAVSSRPVIGIKYCSATAWEEQWKLTSSGPRSPAEPPGWRKQQQLDVCLMLKPEDSADSEQKLLNNRFLKTDRSVKELDDRY